MKNRKLKNSELGRIDAQSFKGSEKTPLIIILDNIRSLNNIGSVFRTADAFLIEKINFPSPEKKYQIDITNEIKKL